MNAKDTALYFMQVMEMGDIRTAESLLAEDFVFQGPTPKPLGKQQFLGLQIALVEAMPDWSFNISRAEVHGDEVELTIQISGTHTRDLTLPLPGMPRVPATGTRVQLPEEHPRLAVREGKISSITAERVPGGGVPGVLAQLGVHMPG